MEIEQLHGPVLDPLELKLLNDYQKGFPLVPCPFAALAEELGIQELEVIAKLQSMQQRGLISRIGAVFRPNVVGVSALAALSVSPDRLDAVAAQVSALAEVNHNYEREHRYNLWFVLATGSRPQIPQVIAAIEAAKAA